MDEFAGEKQTKSQPQDDARHRNMTEAATTTGNVIAAEPAAANGNAFAVGNATVIENANMADAAGAESAVRPSVFLDVRDAAVRYGDDYFSYRFSMGRGEFVGLVGESGSGKTTFLRLLAGVERLCGGDIFMDGRKMNSVPVRKRRIGLVFQEGEIFENLTVAGNLLFPLLAARVGMRKWRGAVSEGLSSVGLSGTGARRASTLSGGEKQRLAVARALMAPPSLLLLDEPFSNIDMRCREMMKSRLEGICGDIPVIMVSHDDRDFRGLADRIVEIGEICRRRKNA